MVSLVLRALALAMDVAVVVLHILGAADVGTMVLLLGIGLLSAWRAAPPRPGDGPGAGAGG